MELQLCVLVYLYLQFPGPLIGAYQKHGTTEVLYGTPDKVHDKTCG